MPGLLSGIVRGIDQNRKTALEQGRLALAKQQVQFQESQVERENRRQESHDAIDSLTGEMTGLVSSSAPDRTYLDQVEKLKPQGPMPNDPKAAEAWKASQAQYDAATKSDEYKAHLTNVQSADQKLQDLGSRRAAHMAKLAGTYAEDANDDAARARFNLAQGKDVTPREAHALLMKASGGNNPAIFVPDQTGVAPSDKVLDQLQEGLKSNDWTDKSDAINAIMPFIHTTVGKKLDNGNTVTDARVTHTFAGKDGNIHYTLGLAHQNESGQGGVTSTPHMSDDHVIPSAALKQGIQDFVQAAQLAKNPKVQSALTQSVQNNDHALGDLMRHAQQFNVVPPAQYKEVPAFGSLVKVGPGGEAEVVATGQQKPTAFTVREIEARRMVSAGEADSLEDAYAKMKGETEAKKPNLRSDRSGGGPPKTRAAWIIQRASALSKEGNLTEAEANEQARKEWPSDAKEPSVTESTTTTDKEGNKRTVTTKKNLETIEGPNKPKGTIWTSKDGKTKRISLGDGKWQTQP